MPKRVLRAEAISAAILPTRQGDDDQDVFDGKKPPWVDPSVFKKAKRENTEKQDSFDL